MKVSFYFFSSLFLSYHFSPFESKIIFRRSRHFNDLMFETFIYILCFESEFLVLHIIHCEWRKVSSFSLTGRVCFSSLSSLPHQLLCSNVVHSQTTAETFILFSRFVYSCTVHRLVFFCTTKQELIVILCVAGMSIFQIH